MSKSKPLSKAQKRVLLTLSLYKWKSVYTLDSSLRTMGILKDRGLIKSFAENGVLGLTYTLWNLTDKGREEVSKLK